MIDLNALDTELRSALSTLEGQTGAIAQARAFKAGESDSRKQALHGVQAGLIIQGDSVAASEVKARATASYCSRAMELNIELTEAEGTIGVSPVTPSVPPPVTIACTTFPEPLPSNTPS